MKRLILPLLILLFVENVPADAGADHRHFRIGLSAQLFGGARKADVVASITLWVESLFHVLNEPMEVNAIMYESIGEMRSGLVNGDIELVAMYPEDVLELQPELALNQIMIMAIDSETAWEYLLLTRSDSGLDSLEALAGKSITFTQNSRNTLPAIWLETRLLERGQQPLDTFFSKSMMEKKASRGALGVFFGKSDACLISRKSYAVLKELNPQIGRELQVVEQSPSFVRAVLCLRKAYDPPSRNQLVDALMNIAEDPRSQQIQNLFGIDRIARGSFSDLENVQEWRTRHQILMKQYGDQKDVL